MFEHLSGVLPPQRHPVLHEELTRLHQAVARAFHDPEDRRQAQVGDYLSLGSTRVHRHRQHG
ncbi:MAG: hypothetical protein ACRERE_04450 [Candidatus Entotheonellia bacterium]